MPIFPITNETKQLFKTTFLSYLTLFFLGLFSAKFLFFTEVQNTFSFILFLKIISAIFALFFSAWVFWGKAQILALFFAFLSNAQIFFAVSIVLASNFLYFHPPLKLNRFLFTEAFFKAINHTSIFLGAIYLIRQSNYFGIYLFLGIYFSLIFKQSILHFKKQDVSARKWIHRAKLFITGLLAFIFLTNYFLMFFVLK